MKLMPVSPVERRLAELPRGNWNWPGADHVHAKLKKAAEYLANGKYTHLNVDHIETMAVLGCGHEETCKAWMATCILNKWC